VVFFDLAKTCRSKFFRTHTHRRINEAAAHMD
jgi:hypothetical protein